MHWRDRSNSDLHVCHGKTRAGGTRILVSVVLEDPAAGRTHERILENHPSLTAEHIRATLGYAADLTRSDPRYFSADPSAVR